MSRLFHVVMDIAAAPQSGASRLTRSPRLTLRAGYTAWHFHGHIGITMTLTTTASGLQYEDTVVGSGGLLFKQLRQGGKRRRKRTYGVEKRGKLGNKPMIDSRLSPVSANT